MYKKHLAALLVSMPMLCTAQASAPATQRVSDAVLRSTGDELASKARTSQYGVSFTALLTRRDSETQVAVRVRSGQAEWHRGDADLLIMLEGEAEVVTGGTVVDGKEIAPGEIRGSSIKNGTSTIFRPGDVLRVEPQTPHQFLLKPGATVRYLAVKTHPGQQ